MTAARSCPGRGIQSLSKPAPSRPAATGRAIAGRDPAFSPLSTHISLFNAIDYVNWIHGWGGAELYNEVYGRFGMVYLPYGITNNESGFRTNKPIRTLEDLKGMRLRLSASSKVSFSRSSAAARFRWPAARSTSRWSVA